MKKAISAALICAVALTFSGCGKNNTEVASVNGEKITAQEFQDLLKLNKSAIEASQGPDIWKKEIKKGVTMKDQYENDLMQQLVGVKAIVSEAKKEGVKVDPKDVDKTFKSQKEAIMKDPNAKKNFEKLGVNIDDLKIIVEDNMYLNKYREKFIKDTKIPEADLKAYYDKNLERFKIDQVDASHILIKTVDKNNKPLDEKKKKEAKAKAEELLKKIKDGGDFAKIAKENSQDEGSAKNGGELGAFSRGQMVPEFEKAAFSMKAGEVSNIVETQYGYHIIKVNKVIKETTPFDKAKEEIKQTLLNEKYNQKVEDIKKKAKTDIKKDEMKKIEF